MTDEALWALGRGTGITALAFLTVSLALGIATRSGRPLVMLPRFAVADVHRFAALAGTLLVALHMALLFFDPYAQLRLVDFVVPFLGAYRPLWLGLGTLAFDLLAVVIVSSLLRHRLGVRVFRAAHWATYALWPIAWRTRSATEPMPAGPVVPAVRRLLCVMAVAARWRGGCAPTTPSTPALEHRGTHDDIPTTLPPEPPTTHRLFAAQGPSLAEHQQRFGALPGIGRDDIGRPCSTSPG